jgi:hypothetical protein
MITMNYIVYVHMKYRILNHGLSSKVSSTVILITVAVVFVVFSLRDVIVVALSFLALRAHYEMDSMIFLSCSSCPTSSSSGSGC